jgi:XRN 5'-3' exonuclease N-terminus
LDCLLKMVEPTKSLVLTFDGPAPFAKLQTQRNRRISSPQNCLITPGRRGCGVSVREGEREGKRDGQREGGRGEEVALSKDGRIEE